MAGNTGGIRAGKAYVELFADGSKLAAGLRAASAKLRAFGMGVRNLGLGMSAMGAAVLAPLAASTKIFATMGDDVAKMATRTGLSTEAVSELGFAADLSGGSLEGLEKSVRRMQATILDAAQGTKTATDALGALNLSYAKLNGLKPEDQFTRITDGLAGIADPTLRAATAMEIFGKSGTDLLPMLGQMPQLRQMARDMGLVVTADQAKAAEKFSDQISVLGKVLKMTAFQAGGALAPAVGELVAKVSAAGAGFAGWVKENKGLLISIAKVGAVVLAAGGALTGLGLAISGVGTVLGVAATAVALPAKALMALGGAIKGVLPLLLNVHTLVLAGAAAMIYFSGAGGKAVQWLGGQFAGLKEDVAKSLSAVGALLASGDLAGATKILLLTVKMETARGMAAVKSELVGWWTGLRAVWVAIKHDVSAIWIQMTTALRLAWVDFESWMLSSVATLGVKIAGGIYTTALEAVRQVKSLTGLPIPIVTGPVESALSTVESVSAYAATGKYRTRRRAEIEAEGSAALGRVDQASEAAMVSIVDLDAPRLERIAAELGRARGEWSEAISAAKGEAGRKAEELSLNPFAPSQPGVGDDPDKQLQLDKQLQKSMVLGTFSGSLASLIFPHERVIGGDAQKSDPIVKAVGELKTIAQEHLAYIRNQKQATFSH